MTKILLTGGAGYIRSVLIPFLLDNGYKTNVYDLLLYGGYSLDCKSYRFQRQNRLRYF